MYDVVGGPGGGALLGYRDVRDWHAPTEMVPRGEKCTVCVKHMYTGYAKSFLLAWCSGVEVCIFGTHKQKWTQEV